MAVGEGKYDAALSTALQHCGARCGVLMVLDGHDGPGFSVQASIPMMVDLPRLLRRMADGIEKDVETLREKQP